MVELQAVFLGLVAFFWAAGYINNDQMFTALGAYGILAVTGYFAGKSEDETEAPARWSAARLNRLSVWFQPAIGALLCVAILLLIDLSWKAYEDALLVHRNFYGVLRIEEYDTDTFEQALQLTHGKTIHGLQFSDELLRREPSSYYGKDTGVGLALAWHPRRWKTDENSLRVGVVGLGCGTMAAHAQPGDAFRFYEIDPDVVDVCGKFFTYLDDARADGADIDLAIGDARVSLERELEGEPDRFDVLVVDAFSSDAIPIHLLTAECATLYQQRLQPDGLLAIHISNRYLELEPVVRGLAEHLGWTAIRVETYGEDEIGLYGTTWVVVTANEEFIELDAIKSRTEEWTEDDGGPLLWTDDFAALWQVVTY